MKCKEERKMPRKPSLDGKDSSLRIRMSPEQKEKLVSYAERHYQTMSNVIFQALDILYAREEQQNNSILLFIILLFFSCVQEIQCLTYNTTHALIVSFCILNKSLFLFWSHPYSYVFFFAIFWCFSSQTYHFPSTSTIYY